MRKILLCVILTAFYILVLFQTQRVFAQASDTLRTTAESELERSVEEIDPEESDLDLEELVEFLVDLANHPLDINRATVQELMQIPALNLRLAQRIVEYRDNVAAYESVDELILLNGIGPVTLERIRPYVTTGQTDQSRDTRISGLTENGQFDSFNRYQRVFQEREGYVRPDSLGGYLGASYKYYHRYRYTSNHLSLNLTQEKDPGEPLNGPGDFDFTSWHIALNDIGILKQIVIGDYSASFGQGLLIWSGGAFGKGRDVINGASKNERGIRPFTSAQEYNGFRGVAATFGNRLQATLFYSTRKRTATLNEDSTANLPSVSGLHRTANERQRRNSLEQTTLGGRIKARFSNGYAGLSGFYNEFNMPIRAGSQPYQLYGVTGSTLSGYSADWNLLLRNHSLYGEAAYTNNGGFGFLSGADIDLGRSTGLILSYRNYGKELHSIFGAGFGEQSGSPQNEAGFYIGLKHRITERVTFSGYFDQFRFPAPRFQTRQPTSGYDWLGLMEFRAENGFELYGLFRYQSKEEEYDSLDDFGREIRRLGSEERLSGRIQAEYRAHPRVRLRTRVEIVRTVLPEFTEEWGFLLFQDIRFYPTDRLRVDARITLFDTDGYDSRVYQFENDLLYVLSNRVLFDRGQRMYLLIHYEPSNWLELWIKLSTTLYDNRNMISSGLEQIQGNRRSDIGVQARIRF